MNTLLTNFLASLEDDDTPTTTIKAIRSDLATLERWYEAEHSRPLRFEDVSTRDVRRWIRHSSRAGQPEAAPATANRRKASLRRLYAWAIRRQLLRSDPTTDVAQLPLGNQVPRSVSDGAIDRILHAARQAEDTEQGLRDEAIVTLLAFCGLRVEELCSLLISDLNLVTRKLLVRMGKGGKDRYVFVRRDALPVLERYLSRVRCPAGLPRAGSAIAEESLWVRRSNREGRPWTPGISQRSVQELVRYLATGEANHARADAALARKGEQRDALLYLAEELDSVTPHTFRHSLARRLIVAGVGTADVQAILGHSSLRVTGMYLTPHETSLEQAFEAGGGLR